MKRILLALWIILLAACGKESTIKPASASTFVRYFNGANSDTAVAVLETADKGLLVLATTVIGTLETKIKLIKTDAYGNQAWQFLYPPFTPPTTNSYKAGGMIVLADGSIVIAGGSTGKDGISHILLMKTDDKGENPKIVVDSTGIALNQNISGTAVTQTSGGDFLVVGTLTKSVNQNNIFLAQIDGGLDSVKWADSYGNGDVVTLSNKIFLDNTQNSLFLAGTVNRGVDAIRLSKVSVSPANWGATEGDVSPSNPAIGETANDFCQYGSSFVFIGEKTDSIIYRQVRLDGGSPGTPTLTILAQKSFAEPPGYTQPVPFGHNGNSVCVTQDGGLLLLATVHSVKTLGDYYLIKVDPFGTPEWTTPRIYGGQFDDTGVQVIQASDGGYVVLGTTNLANLKTIMLMKTDKLGKIQ